MQGNLKVRRAQMKKRMEMADYQGFEKKAKALLVVMRVKWMVLQVEREEREEMLEERKQVVTCAETKVDRTAVGQGIGDLVSRKGVYWIR